MHRFFLVGATLLLAPAFATAAWVHTSINSTPYTVNLSGRGNVTAGAWTTKFFNTDPGAPPSMAIPNKTLTTYCASPDESNSSSDYYEIGVEKLLNVSPMVSTSGNTLFHAISYALNFSEAAGQQKVRAAVQAAIWHFMDIYGNSSHVVGSFNAAAVTDGVDGIYSAIINHAATNAVAWSSLAWTGTDKHVVGLPQGDPNQDMVWTVDGPNGGLDPESAPIPASAFGAMGIFALLLFSRRFFAIA